MSAIGAAAIGGVLGIGDTLIGTAMKKNADKASQRRQHMYNKALLRYEWQNSAPQQVASLRAAGLNPGLAYSNGGPSLGASTGNVGTGSSMETPSFGGAIASLTNAFKDLKLKDAQTEELTTQADVNRAEVLLDEKKAIWTEMDTMRIKLANERDPLVRKQIEADIKQKEKRVEEIDANIGNLTSLQNRNTAETDLLKAKTLTENEMRAVNKELAQVGVKAKWQEVYESMSRERRNDAETDLLIEKAVTEYDVRQKLREECKTLGKERDLMTSKIANIEADTSLTPQRKAKMISDVVSNYGRVANDLVDNIRKVVKDSKEGKGKTDKEIESIVGDLTDDLVVDALLSYAM